MYTGMLEYIQDLILELFTIALEHSCVGEIGTYIGRRCITIDD